MQAVGMLRGTGAIYFLVILTTLIGHARPLPLQILPSIPGYIPVYIRHGDEPLIEINPALAEAFHEDLAVPKSLQLDNAADLPGGNVEEDHGFVEESKEKIDQEDRASGNEAHAAPKDEDYGKTIEKETADDGLTKILPFEFHRLGDKHRRREHHESRKHGSVSKEAVVKVGPLSDAEKEELDRFRIRIEKQETGEEPRAKAPERTKLSRDFAPVISLGDAVDNEKTDLPRIRLTHAAEQSSSRGESSNPGKQPATKLQPEGVPSNVRKLLPVDVEATTGSSDEPGDNAGPDDAAD